MRSRLAIALVLLLALQSWAAVSLPEEARERASAWEEAPFRDVAVLEPFSHQTFADYSDVAVVINNQSEVSRTIGTAFALARNIPPERVLLLTNESTPTNEIINSNQFTTYFANPISQMIIDRNLTDLNVLVTTKGIPLGVNGGTNSRASFDSELALIGGPYASAIFGDWYVNSNYGMAAGNEMKAFERDEQGYYLVSRLTGYDVDTALNLISKTNNSFGQHGQTVLDLATNRNGSGYKWWNDLLYTTNETLTNMGFPVHFNQNGTYVTNMENVSMYAAWGSNDGSWGDNELSNSGYDTSDGSWATGARYWDGIGPSLSAGEQWWWARQTETKRNGNAAMEGRLDDAPCGANDASTTNGLLAEYFDNNGVSYNVSTMVNLTGRTPDFVRHEPNIDWPSTQSAWTGLDSRFLEYWSARHTGIIHIPTAGNWTFYLRSDDGSKLWIDDVEIVDNQGHHAMQERSGTVWLDSGEHTLRTEFFEHGGYAGLELKWEGPSISKQTVPTNVLTRGSSIPVRQSDLIHHWEFNENSGDIANDSVGTSHLNFTGTNGSQWRNCVLGNCAYFDGIDDEARVDVTDSVTDFTVSLWVQANHSGQSRHASAIAVNDVAGDDDSFQIQTGGGNPGSWELYHNNSYSFGTVDPTVWQHLVATFENDSVTLYLDGVEILNQTVPNGTVNSIEIYKFGVNRAGSTHFAGVIDEVQIWDAALTENEVKDVHDEIVWICPTFNSTNNSVAYVEQTFDIDSEFEGHAWVLDGYSMREGWVEGDWWLEVEAFDSNGTSLSMNMSDDRSFSDDWQSRQLRFRPHVLASQFTVRQVAEFSDGTYNGSIFFDTLKLYPILPHFTWLDGSIAETAVSTGGRTFVFNSSYGQSLVSDLLDDGVSGVKGYVYEPYLDAISNPEELLSCYANGFTMLECYAASNTLLSWMGAVIGDPKMAAYSDRLHDVNVSQVRTTDRLSVGENGTVEVLLENLAPGVGSGYLEIRDRQNNLLLANESISIPGGNDVGSRFIAQVNVTPVRTGFVEFIVRWIPESNHPERILSNNLALLNIEINAPPVLDELTCSTTTATRGGVVICKAEVTDDFGMSGAILSWRYNNSSDPTYNSLTAYPQSSGDVWTAAISLPVDAPFDSVDLHWILFDTQNLSIEASWDAAFNITDASATWYGVHVEGADLAPWLGIDPPVHGDLGWVRGQEHAMTACVIDIDHNNATEIPTILVDGLQLAIPTQSSSSGSQTCYQSSWIPIAGGALEPVSVTLQVDGVEWSNRSLTPIDLPPTAELTIDDGQSYLDGAQNHVLVQIIDEDDPDSDYSIETSIDWPGAGFQMLDEDIATAPPGLESGDALISTRITSGIWADMNWSWTKPVFLTPPQISTPTLCVDGILVDTVHRGADGTNIWVGVSGSRPIQDAMIRLGSDDSPSSGFSSIYFEQGVPPTPCVPGTGQHTQYYRMEIDPDTLLNRPLGAVELVVNLRDIDGISGLSESLSFGLVGSQPHLDFSAMPTNLVSGNQTTLIVTISDSDGMRNMECSILLKDEDEITLISQIYRPDSQGLWSIDWTPPGRTEANHTLYFACLDETSLSVSESVLLRAREGNSTEEAGENPSQQSNNSTPFTVIVALIGTVLILLIAMTTVLKGRGEEDHLDVDDEIPDEVWARRDENASDEQLAEMAGVEVNNSKQWSDEELLNVGWTQAQIDAYRLEQQQEGFSEEIIDTIEEEE